LGPPLGPRDFDFGFTGLKAFKRLVKKGSYWQFLGVNPTKKVGGY